MPDTDRVFFGSFVFALCYCYCIDDHPPCTEMILEFEYSNWSSLSLRYPSVHSSNQLELLLEIYFPGKLPVRNILVGTCLFHFPQALITSLPNPALPAYGSLVGPKRKGHRNNLFMRAGVFIGVLKFKKHRYCKGTSQTLLSLLLPLKAVL